MPEVECNNCLEIWFYKSSFNNHFIVPSKLVCPKCKLLTHISIINENA